MKVQSLRRNFTVFKLRGIATLGILLLPFLFLAQSDR